MAHAGQDSLESNVQTALREKPERRCLRHLWLRCVLGLVLVAATSLASLLVRRRLSSLSLGGLYLLDVLVAALYLGRGPAVLTAAIGALVFDLLFLFPGGMPASAVAESLIWALAFLAVTLVVGELADQAKREAARQRESGIATLYALSRAVAALEEPEEVAEAILHHIEQIGGYMAAVFLPAGGAEQTLDKQFHSPGWELGGDERAAAAQVFRSGIPSDGGTARAYYAPMKTARGVVGVLGVRLRQESARLTADEQGLWEAFASQAALAIERAQLASAARRVELLQVTERLQAALLSSISHDLRTPLVTITGTLSALEDDEPLLDDAARRTMVQAAREEAERLNWVVENLLDMSRIEAGALRVTCQLCDIEDVIGSALEQFGKRLENRSVSVMVPDGLPLIPLDFVLIVQVLVNVIDNALKYSPPEAPIEITVELVGAEAWIRVADRGIGIPPEDLEHVFDKFYRVRRPDQVTGAGLGLSIARGFVEAHGGRIWAENRSGGGVTMTIALPCAKGGQEK